MPSARASAAPSVPLLLSSERPVATAPTLQPRDARVSARLRGLHPRAPARALRAAGDLDIDHRHRSADEDEDPAAAEEALPARGHQDPGEREEDQARRVDVGDDGPGLLAAVEVQ